MNRNINKGVMMKNKSVPFSSPKMGGAECRAVNRILKSGWLTTGNENRLFEEEFSRFAQGSHCLTVNSATSALHLLLEALDVGQDDWVLTTPYTFTASSEIIRYLGAHPLFVDIDESTGNMDPLQLEKMIKQALAQGKSLKAVLPVHIAGLPCDMNSIMTVSRNYKLPLIEDCAHTFPVRYSLNGEMKWVGTLGDGGAFSFYANKTITTGEGGMIVTTRDDLKERMQLMRLHGIDRDVWNRYSKEAGHLSWQYDIKAPGFKYNMTNFQAAMGRVQLRKALKYKEERKKQAFLYHKAFENMETLEIPPSGDDHAWHLYMLRLNLEKLSISRNDFMLALFERGINCSVHFKPLHMMTYYKETYHFKDEDFPKSLSLYERTISLPIYPGLSKSDQKRVITAVRETSDRFRIDHE
jgi:dTDP-4-amino-4,6-dideoxygalactose transaminase